MLNSELIAKLQQLKPDAKVKGTFEHTINEIDVYEAADGTILIDVDNNEYKDTYQRHGHKFDSSHFCINCGLKELDYYAIPSWVKQPRCCKE